MDGLLTNDDVFDAVKAGVGGFNEIRSCGSRELCNAACGLDGTRLYALRTGEVELMLVSLGGSNGSVTAERSSEGWTFTRNLPPHAGLLVPPQATEDIHGFVDFATRALCRWKGNPRF